MSSIEDMLEKTKEKVEEPKVLDAHEKIGNMVDSIASEKKEEKKSLPLIPAVDKSESKPKKEITKESEDYISPLPPTPRELKKRQRKEKRRKKEPFDTFKFVFALFTISVFALLYLYNYMPEDPVLFSAIMLLGSFLFLPIGMILGQALLDPYMRCRLLRRITKKNLGIINFVGKSKRMVSKLKNFDDDLIWIGKKCWAITKEGIYEVDKYGTRHGNIMTIDPDSVVTMTETVPVIFMDLGNMHPLSLHEIKGGGITPEELGANLTGWIDNQQAKLMFLKRTMETYYMILIVVAIAAAYFGYQNSQEIAEMRTLIQDLAGKIDRLIGPGLIRIFF